MYQYLWLPLCTEASVLTAAMTGVERGAVVKRQKSLEKRHYGA